MHYIDEDTTIPKVHVKEHKTKLLAVIDDDTGNLEYYAKLNNKRRIIGGAWMAVFQNGIDWISNLKLPSEVLWVFMKICAKMDFNNYIRISQKDVAEELGMKQPHVSRAIKKLLELDIIAEGPRAGLCKTYILNPQIGMKGKQKQQKIIDFEEKKSERRKEKFTEKLQKAKKEPED